MSLGQMKDNAEYHVVTSCHVQGPSVPTQSKKLPLQEPLQNGRGKRRHRGRRKSVQSNIYPLSDAGICSTEAPGSTGFLVADMPTSNASCVVSMEVGSSASSKALRFPARPGYGQAGSKCVVKANHFFAELPKKDLNQYDVTITPEVASKCVNRAIMAELVKLYRESDLDMRLPAYDGRKILYTAGVLPFTSKEFVVKLVDEEYGIHGPKREKEFKVALKFVARADLQHLTEFLAGKTAEAPQEALQVLDIVLRELSAQRWDFSKVLSCRKVILFPSYWEATAAW